MKRYSCLPRTDIEALEKADPPVPMPNGFTGVWKGVQFYKGKQWFGPTHLVGFKRALGRERMLTRPEHE